MYLPEMISRLVLVRLGFRDPTKHPDFKAIVDIVNECVAEEVEDRVRAQLGLEYLNRPKQTYWSRLWAALCGSA